MAGVKKDKIANDSANRGETGARKYPARPGAGNVQDGISRGGTETGDPKDRPPKDGCGLAEPVSGGKERPRKQR